MGENGFTSDIGAVCHHFAFDLSKRSFAKLQMYNAETDEKEHTETGGQVSFDG